MINHWIRQIHRWLGVLFVGTVVANFVALAITQGEMPPAVITYAPLLPLFLLMGSGLWLFALPYVLKLRKG